MLNTVLEFYDNGSNVKEVVAINDKIYGTTNDNGKNGFGSLFEYDTASNSFVIKLFFGDNTASDFYFENLVTANNKIYGIQTGLFSGASIVEYDPTTNILQQLFTLSSIGINEVNDLVISNGKLYGINIHTSNGSDNYLFSYDISNNSGVIEHTFDLASGTWGHSLLAHSNGNIYGATINGGLNGDGVIFELNTTTNNYSVLYDLTSTNKADNLTEGLNDNLYGYINPNLNDARIYSFNLSNNTFSNLFNFSSNQPTGNAAYFRDYNPFEYDNEHLVVSTNSANSQRVLLDYDIQNNTLNSNIITGESLISKPINGSFYYGIEDKVYKYLSNNITEVTDIVFGTNGKNPIKIIKVNDSEIYGITSEKKILSNYGDVLFKYNLNSQNFEKIIDFDGLDLGYPSDIIKTTGGLIYISTQTGNAGLGSGELIEYNPSTNNYQVVHQFNNLGSAPETKLHEKNNIIYGNKGDIIYSFNTTNHTFSTLFQSSELDGVYNRTYLSNDNVFYGISGSGGVNSFGVVYSFDISSNQYTKLSDLTSPNYTAPFIGPPVLTDVDNSFTEDSNNIYGIFLQSNDSSNNGAIFSIDKTSNSLSILQSFDGTNGTGYKPQNLYSIDNSLIGKTLNWQTGSSGSFNTVFEYNSNTLSPVSNFDSVFISNLETLNNLNLILNSSSTTFEYDLINSNEVSTFQFNSNIEQLYSVVEIIDDTVAPTAPTNLIANNPTNTTIDLNWNESTDNTGVFAYNIYQDGVLSFTSSNNFITANNLTADTNYCFTISALDNNGNESTLSNQACETTTNEDAEPTNEIYFSEYVEGSSTNKALEIANFTGNSINLSNYSIKLAFNGNSFGSDITFPSGAVISEGDVYVIANTGLSSSCQSEQDFINNSMTSFNGNDAIGLFKNGILIDIIGSEGNSSNFAQNLTLVRKSSVTNPSVIFDINQWDSYAQDDCSNLGNHTQTLSIENFNSESINFYPNPVSNTLNIEINQNNFIVEIYSIQGQILASHKEQKIIDVSNLSSGLYMLRIIDNSNRVKMVKFIKR